MRPRCHARRYFRSGFHGNAGKLVPERLLRRVRKVEQQMVGELPPAELAQVDADGFSAFAVSATVAEFTYRGPDLPRH